MDIAIDAVPIGGKPVIDQLLQLYIHDFSEYAGFDVDDRGRYDYRRLDSYWTEANRFPFLVRADGNLAGFALVYVEEEDGVPVAHMAEFFVMRKYRRQGVGRVVAMRLFDRFPGQWQVTQLHENIPAQQFWRSVIGAYTNGDYRESTTGRRVIQAFCASPTPAPGD